MCSCRFGSSLATCHCSRCHVSFTNVASFDAHQRSNGDGTTRCMEPEFTLGLYKGVRQDVAMWSLAGPGWDARERERGERLRAS